MKRVIALLLVILIFTGCAFPGTGMKEPVTFYYQRTHTDNSTYDDFFSEGIIGSEMREAAGHRENLNYLLSIYFSGPLDPGLSSPFPAGSRVLEIQQEDGRMSLLLSPMRTEKSDLEVTVACACLAMTCLELTDADTVQIESRDYDDKILFSRTFTRDNLFLIDDYSQPVESTENPQ